MSTRMIQNSTLDRLYLSRSDTGDVYVDCKLPQHQIDGIRFLFRQFDKKNPGVILNDPPGYGKRVQTVLFLNAMIDILQKPILILCLENDCEKWMERFREWTPLQTPELVVIRETGGTNKSAFAPEMKVCIMPIANVPALSSHRRGWSVVVVDDQTVGKDIVKYKSTSNTLFKILITTLDMKANLETFYTVCDWLYQKGKLNVRQVVTENEGNATFSSLLLDSLMEDIVLRRKDFLTRFIEAEKINKSIKPKPVITKKNKDATGTKIKRTKRKLDDNNTPNNNNAETSRPNNDLANASKTDKEQSDSEMDIETFIRNTKPIRLEFNDKYIDTTSESGADDAEEREVEKSGGRTPYVSDTSNSSIRLFEDRIENTRRNLTNDFDSIKDIVEPPDRNENLNKNTIDMEKSNDLCLIAKLYENRVIDDGLSDENGEKNDNKVAVLYKDDILHNINTIAVDCDVSDNETVTIKLFDHMASPKEMKTNDGVHVKEIKVGGKTQTKFDNIDDEVFEIEQSALKKFKGSLLDSIF